MPKSKLTNIYFSHDRDSRNDDKIAEMMFKFRRASKTMKRADLEQLAGISCYSIFWSVLEYMHRNGFYDKDINLLADDLRIRPEFLKKVLNDFRLFQHKGNEYISERMQRDIKIQNEKSKRAQRAANIRWLLPLYDELYLKEFGVKPVLSNDEILKLADYAEVIENFRQVLPDIFYTLKSLKFDGKINFSPKSNWLLKDNNLARIYHGEFGELKHKKTPAEIKAEEKLKQKEKEEKEQPKETDILFQTVKTKEDAVKIIAEKYSKKSDTLGVIIYPQAKKLAEKFNITKEDISSALCAPETKAPDEKTPDKNEHSEIKSNTDNKSASAHERKSENTENAFDNALKSMAGKAAAVNLLKEKIKLMKIKNFKELPAQHKRLIRTFNIRAQDLLDTG